MLWLQKENSEQTLPLLATWSPSNFWITKWKKWCLRERQCIVFAHPFYSLSVSTHFIISSKTYFKILSLFINQPHPPRYTLKSNEIPELVKVGYKLLKKGIIC